MASCSILLGRDGTTRVAVSGREDLSTVSLNPCFATRSATLDACDWNIQNVIFFCALVYLNVQQGENEGIP